MGWGGKLVEVTRVVYIAFLDMNHLSLVMDVSLPSDTGRVPFIWEIYFMFSRDKEGLSVFF